LPSAPVANGTFSTLFCESFLRCLSPYHGGPTECTCLVLPRRHRPSPGVARVGFPLHPANTIFHGRDFRGCSYSVMFRPPSLLASQIVPTAASFPAGQLRRLRPSRTCVVTFARIGYASRPTTGNWRREDFHLARFPALSTAPYSSPGMSCSDCRDGARRSPLLRCSAVPRFPITRCLYSCRRMCVGWDRD
jgi:hypothetical protein